MERKPHELVPAQKSLRHLRNLSLDHFSLHRLLHLLRRHRIRRRHLRGLHRGRHARPLPLRRRLRLGTHALEPHERDPLRRPQPRLPGHPRRLRCVPGAHGSGK